MEYQENQNPYLSRQHSNLLDDVLGLEFRPDLEVEEPGEEEGAAEAGDEPPDLVGLDGDEALVATVLAVLLLEHDAGDAVGLALLGGDGLAGGGAWDCADGLGMFGVWFGEIIEVYRWGFGVLKHSRCRVLAEVPEAEGSYEHRAVDPHRLKTERGREATLWC